MNLFKKYYLYLKYVWSYPSEGFGDFFAKITKSFGFKPCGGCEKRRKAWNEKIKFKKNQNL